jgi:predicted nucleic acid-binding protein
MASAKSIFVDANVIIEVLLNRRRRRICEKSLSIPSATYHLSALSVHLVYHFCELDRVDPGLAKLVIDRLNILPVTAADVSMAQSRYKGKDFEDCLQASCAEANQCGEILTLDGSFAKLASAKLPVKVIR